MGGNTTTRRNLLKLGGAGLAAGAMPMVITRSALA
jgi:hypothetical protein